MATDDTRLQQVAERLDRIEQRVARIEARIRALGLSVSFVFDDEDENALSA